MKVGEIFPIKYVSGEDLSGKAYEEYTAVQEQNQQKYQARIIARIEALGFDRVDGWFLVARPGTDFVLVSHPELSHQVLVGLRNGDLVAQMTDAPMEPVYVCEARRLLEMMEMGWRAAVEDVPQEDLTQRALEVAQELGAARQKWVAAVIEAARVERGARIAVALAEQRAIDEAGGEKEMGANAEARARALAIAMQRDLGYGAAITAQAEAQAEVAKAKAEMDGRQDELRVLTAAMRMAVDED